MSGRSKIEWTGDTWNPVTGCTKVSPACANCYIERQTPMRVTGRRFVRGHIPLEFHENRLDAPLRRRQPTTYFVNSMSDLFHEDVPDGFIDRVFAVMALAPRHTFQVLTKRAARMHRYFNTRVTRHIIGAAAKELPGGRPTGWQGKCDNSICNGPWPLPNVWLGVSVENQHFADERIPLLLQTPAAVRFLSCEPLLGPLTFRWAKWDDGSPSARRAEQGFAPVERDGRVIAGSVNHLDGLRMLDWVITGGESGPNARPSDPDWFRSLRDQCVDAGVPFFFKQWGEWAPGECAEFHPKRSERTATLIDGVWDFGSLTPQQSEDLHREDEPDLYRLGKKRAGRLLDGVEWSQMPGAAR